MGSLALFEKPAGRDFAIDRNVASDAPSMEAFNSTKRFNSKARS